LPAHGLPVNKIDVTILIPAHNEASRIGLFLEELLAFIRDFTNKDNTTFEVLVAEDGSSDETLEIAKRFTMSSSAIRVLHHNHRLGKGGALKAAFKESRGEVVIFMDADGGYRPSEIPLFLKALEMSSIAIGIRSPNRMRPRPPIPRIFAGLIFNLLFRILFFSHVHDTQAGFKAFRRTALQTLLPSILTNGFEMDVEIIVKAKYHGLDLVKVPISYRYVGGSNIKVIGDGVAMAFSLLRMRIDTWSRRKQSERCLTEIQLKSRTMDGNA